MKRNTGYSNQHLKIAISFDACLHFQAHSLSPIKAAKNDKDLYTQNDKQTGPFKIDEINSQLAAGSLLYSDMAFMEGMETGLLWTRNCSVNLVSSYQIKDFEPIEKLNKPEKFSKVMRTYDQPVELGQLAKDQLEGDGGEESFWNKVQSFLEASTT